MEGGAFDAGEFLQVAAAVAVVLGICRAALWAAKARADHKQRRQNGGLGAVTQNLAAGSSGRAGYDSIEMVDNPIFHGHVRINLPQEIGGGTKSSMDL